MIGPRATLVDEEIKGLRLKRSSQTIVFADVVDSVRLIDRDEEGTVKRWLSFVNAVEEDIAKTKTGRVVKRLGDGIMLEFDDPANAVKTALKMRRDLVSTNKRDPERQNIDIRIGLHTGEVLRGPDSDLYGRDVNIAARLASAARPGQVMASAFVRDALANSLDAEFEDIGPVYLKNVPDPIHAFQVVAPNEFPHVTPLMSAEDLLPTIAMLPLSVRNNEDGAIWGDMLTDDLIAALSRSHRMNVISHLSTMAISAESETQSLLYKTLGANFLISGSCSVGERYHVLDLNLTQAGTRRVVWSDRIRVEASQLLQKNAIFSDVANDIHRAIVDLEMKQAANHPIPTLDGYEILMAAVALMHRLSRDDFDRAGKLLDALIERIPHNSVPLAWKSRWHVLKVVQGWSKDREEEAQRAQSLTHRALDLDPTNSSALIAEGFVQTHLLHNLDEAADLYDSALEYTPNEATGRALRGTLYAFRGEGALAVRDAERSLHLTPRDPNRFFFQCLAGSASLVAGDYPRALELVKSSLRLNRRHMSSLRMLAVIEWRMENQDAARAALKKILAFDPGFTISSWKHANPSAELRTGQAFAATLKEIGVPD
jgi:class 3 adenylate cyclase/TolB-like protein